MQKRLSAAEMTLLVNDHYGAMVSYARSRTGISAEDIVQTAFLNLVRYNHEKGCPGNPVFWLYRAIRNEAVSQWRKESRRKDREKRVFTDNFTFSFVQSDPADWDAEEIGRALARLESDLQEVVYLRIWGGLTFDEIAQVTGQSRSAIFRAYQEGLRKLKRDFDCHRIEF